MFNETRFKIALVTLLVGAAFLGRPPGHVVFTIAALVFGIFNVAVSVSGTERVRFGAVAIACAGLVWPASLGVVVFIAMILWPAVFLGAWALAGGVGQTSAAQEHEGWQERAATPARIAVSALIVAVGTGSIMYRLLVEHALQQTAALFVGVPALIAIAVVFLISPQSSTGVACKAVTVGLLMSLVLLQEGILCILMSAPIFYAVAIAIATTVGSHRDRKSSSIVLPGVILLVVPMSLEGVTPLTTFSRDESVSVTKIVQASPDAIERALYQQPRFERVLPLYLRAGFPSPVETRIDRHGEEMRWVIRMRGGEMLINGMEHRAGDLVLALEEARPGLVRWSAVSDDSHMTHFLRWREIVVSWEPVDERETRVTWTLRYERGLDPAWYFGPWERYAVRLAAGYLIDAVATP